MTLPQTTIDVVKQYAFYNYCSAAKNPDASFEDVETWSSDAQLVYYAILGFVSGKQLHWPGEVPELIKKIAGATEWAGKAEEHLIPALEWIKTYGPCDERTVKFIDNALAKYREVSNG
jgi:hypothetical protein